MQNQSRTRILKTPKELGYEHKHLNYPENGWEKDSYYLVDVSFNSHNPIHRRIFYSGFIGKDGCPAGYNQFWDYEDHLEYRNAYYLEVVEKLNIDIP